MYNKLLGSNISNVTVTPYNGEEVLVTLDNTKMIAVNTCPTYGILRYELHKTFDYNNRRAVALEAGQACHDVFAFIRLYQLGLVQGLHAHAEYHGERIFGSTRWDKITAKLSSDHKYKIGSWYEELTAAMLEVLYTSGFVDDPEDKKRTLSQMEETCIQYLAEWNFTRYPVYVEDETDCTKSVGIEIPVDVLIKLDDKNIRFTGKIDGLHLDNDQLCVQENKTTMYLNDIWESQFQMAHQVTGYCLVTSAMYNREVLKASVLGSGLGGTNRFRKVNLTKDYVNFERWINNLIYTINTILEFKNDVINAPKHSHSCTRYFRECSFLPLCMSSNEDFKRTMEDEMVTDEWNPLSEDGGE